jgi:hypothetical protein
VQVVRCVQSSPCLLSHVAGSTSLPHISPCRSNFGSYAVFFAAQARPGGAVHCFEPQRKMAQVRPGWCTVSGTAPASKCRSGQGRAWARKCVEWYACIHVLQVAVQHPARGYAYNNQQQQQVDWHLRIMHAAWYVQPHTR